MEEEGSDDGTFDFRAEGEPGNLIAVLVFECPECGSTTRFTAQDEDAAGVLRCSCGSSIEVEGDGLRGAQRKLDEVNRSINDLGKTFEGFGH